MKILIYSISHAPEVTGTGKYTGGMAAWLAARGHSVRVVAAPPYYPSWKVSEGYSSWKYKSEKLDGVDVFRCPLYVPSRPSGLRRLPHLLSFALSSLPVVLWQALRWRPDVVMIVKPTVLCAPAALVAARLSGAVSWLHVQDFEVEASFQLGMLPSFIRPLAGPILAVNRFLTRSFARVSTISQSMESRLVECGVPRENIVSFPNWVDTETFKPDLERRSFYRRKLGLRDSDSMVLYGGNMGSKQGLNILLEAADSLRGLEGLRFFLTGGGGEKASLQKRASEMGLDNLQFLPLTPDEDMPALLAAADLHVVIQRRGAADLVMPSKLTGILAVGGRALVTADPDTELGRLVHENPGLYELVPPEDPAALAQAIRAHVERGGNVLNPAARAFAVGHLSTETVLVSLEKDIASSRARRPVPGPRVALIHDWLTGMRGGERVLESLCRIFPAADLFTLIHKRGATSSIIEKRRIITSFLQFIPGATLLYRYFLPLMPLAVESLDLSGYDLIISSSHCVAKAVKTPPGSLHVCYCHTPMRYIWDHYETYFSSQRSSWFVRVMMSIVRGPLQRWDVSSNSRVDRFIANSSHVEGRIKRIYGRPSTIIHPPVEIDDFQVSRRDEGYYLLLTALVPYKRADLAIEAFNRLKLPLRVVGSGPEMSRLRRMAKSNVTLMGWLSRSALPAQLAGCRALIFPGEEDFGIVPLEAMASGKPVIALGRGGALETVVGLDDGQGRPPTGVFFPEETPESLMSAVRRFESFKDRFDADALRGHTLRFRREVFEKEIFAFIDSVWRGHVKDMKGAAGVRSVASLGKMR